jgi:hypothetical protein
VTDLVDDVFAYGILPLLPLAMSEQHGPEANATPTRLVATVVILEVLHVAIDVNPDHNEGRVAPDDRAGAILADHLVADLKLQKLIPSCLPLGILGVDARSVRDTVTVRLPVA